MKSKIQAVLMLAFSRAKFLALLFSLGALALALPLFGQAQLVLYDDFSLPRIDPSKWIGLDGDFTSVRDAVRRVAQDESGSGAGFLHLFNNSYAFANSDSGGTGGVFGLGFPNPESLTDLSFTVMVKRMVAIGCDTNSSPSIGSVEFRGRFFNTEISPTSQLGDVESVIGPSRVSTDTGTQFTIVAFYQRCDDANCGARTTLDLKVLGSVNPGEASTLRIKWDRPNHQFVYQLNQQPQVISPYTVSDVSAAVGQGKGIDITHVVANCTTTPRPVVTTEAYFSNIYTNH
ncbi:MAG TPA: hypothetical protein VJN92_20280 [Candidatus Acidoferrum sp.]|nr:hypothetical protein [Candidatus Acidoferrum sp.]